MVLVNFIRDRNVGIFARVKRLPRATKVASPPIELDVGCADEWRQRDAEGMRQRK